MNNELMKEILNQISKNNASGFYGERVKDLTYHYSIFEIGNELNESFILDYFDDLSSEPEIRPILDNLLTYMLVIYRDLRTMDKDLSITYLKSFIKDFKNKPNSKLILKYQSLVESALVFKENIDTEDSLTLFSICKTIIQNYNEFLNSYFSWAIIALQKILKQRVNTNFFNIAYSKKVEKFNQLTKGLLIEFTNTARPDLRNSISHNDIFFMNDEGIIHYNLHNKKSESKEMSLEDFISLSVIASWFPRTFLVSIAICLIIEEGNSEQLETIPENIICMFK